MLRNMVGPGEVDDELEDEVASECAKYGTVTRVLIFEITELCFPREEAVRIFVQFERPVETTKALIDLDGRFFGGNVVRARLYDEDKCSKNELAPVPGKSVNALWKPALAQLPGCDSAYKIPVETSRTDIWLCGVGW